MAQAVPDIVAIAWVLIGTVTALLPMRRQLVPGLALLVSAPVLLVWLGLVHGLWIVLAGLAAVVSMFRLPLRHLWSRLRQREEG